MVFSKEERSHTLSGVLFVALFALSSLYLAEMKWAVELGISSLVIAIIFGIAYSNTLRHRLPELWVPGIDFSAKQLLRLAIILYGFRVTFQQIGSVGLNGLFIDLFVVISTLILGTLIGTKVFKIDRHLSLLISSGAAICGAAAVLAVESIIKSEPYKATVAVGSVVLFGTLSMFLYPLLQQLNLFGFTESQFGLFAGASIHEVAQVVVAGTNISAESGNIAIIVKMTRVLLLVPVLFLLPFYEKIYQKDERKKHRLNIPWFAIGFIAAIGINSLKILPLHVVNLIGSFDNFLLTMAMAAIGMETNLTKIKRVGIRPLYLAFALFIWLTFSVYLMATQLTYEIGS